MSVVVPVLATCLLAGACGDDGETDPQARVVDVYATTIEAVVAEARPVPDQEEDEEVTVFVSPHDDADISAEVQVGVVNALDDWAMVRFIDEIDEAIDTDADSRPVRDDGVLVGLGPVADGAATATVTADRYVPPDATILYEVSLRRRGGTWELDEPLDGVDALVP